MITPASTVFRHILHRFASGIVKARMEFVIHRTRRRDNLRRRIAGHGNAVCMHFFRQALSESFQSGFGWAVKRAAPAVRRVGSATSKRETYAEKRACIHCTRCTTPKPIAIPIQSANRSDRLANRLGMKAWMASMKTP
jgi:Fe-S oxidoreductase